jgi:hypothetical protein
MPAAALTDFLNIFDVVLEDEEVGLALASQADERLVVVFDGSGNFLAVLHLHPHDVLFSISCLR